MSAAWAGGNGPAAFPGAGHSSPSPPLLKRPGSRQGGPSGSPEVTRTLDFSPVPSLNSSRGPDDEPPPGKWISVPFNRIRRSSAPKALDEGELRAKILLSRIRRLLAVKRRNWFSFFASFDAHRDGMLQEADFEAALRSMGAPLSDQELREVRAHVQGTASCVSIDHFGLLLQQAAPPEVSRVESWGRTLLSGLAKEAGKSSRTSADGLGPGAMVRVQDLTSDAGMQLNGLEGMVDKWDSQTSRWVVWLNNGELKSIRPEHLQVVRSASKSPPPGSSAGIASTVAFYKLLCKGGETTVPQQSFLASLQELSPDLDDAQGRRLLVLLPKNREGLVDVPEVLGQLVASPAGGDGSQHSRQGASLSEMRSFSEVSTTVGGESLPGSVPSPRELKPSKSSASKPGFQGPSRAYVQAVLLRLGRRVLSRPPLAGPGAGVLRLFAANCEAARPEELREAAACLPLGVSGAELQGVFEHMRDSAGPTAAHYRDGAIPFAQLESVIEAAYGAGLPPEVAELGKLDLAPLASAMRRLAAGARDGRVSPSDFRAAATKAIPSIAASQLELLSMMTDKEGDGFLLPNSLLAEMRADSGAAAAAAAQAARVAVRELPLPKAARMQEAGELIAPAVPRPLVADAILARVQDRLLAAGLQGRLRELLGLLGVSAAREATVRRNVLVSALAQLRLGISALEAEELVGYLCGVKASAGDVPVSLADFFAGAQRGGSPEDWLPVYQMRELARQKLAGRGAALAGHAAACRRGEWLAEREFRRCLVTALSKDGQKVSSGEEDRIVLLAERNTAGEVRWQPFVQTYAGIRVGPERGPKTPSSKPAEPSGGTPSKLAFWRVLFRRKSKSKEVSTV